MTGAIPERSECSGFTLIELIVVLAVMSLLAGSMVPLTTAQQRAERVEAAESELDELGKACEAYYFDNGSFPAAVSAVGFYGVYVFAGVGDDRVKDEWGSKAFYRVSRTFNPDTITVYSVGENGVDNGASSEAFKVVVQARDPGDARTRMRMGVIAGAVAKHLANGNTLTGTWSTDRAAMSLGSSYQADGYGTDFTLDAATKVLRSAGADRSFNTSDDLVL